MSASVDKKNLERAGLKLARIWYLLGALMLILVGVASLMPVTNVGVGDKTAHVVTYFMLAGWFSLLSANRSVLSWSMVGLIGYGMLMELLQALTGYRHAEWADVVANSIGTALGMLIYFTPLARLFRFIDGRLALVFLR